MEIKYKKISDLMPYANNARTHSEEQVAQICASIREFGFTNPLLIDESGGIIAGHGRLAAAKILKMDEVPTIELKGLTEAQKRAYVIADNQLALNAGWDEDLLKLELIALDDVNFDYSEIMNFQLELNDDIEEIIPKIGAVDKEPVQNISFTVSDEQKEIIYDAIKKAGKYEPSDPMGINTNSNGNALYYICEFFGNKG